MRIKGRIKHWNRDKAYGFIAPESGAKEVFVHINAFDDQTILPDVGQQVSFAMATDRQGRPCAARVTLGNSPTSVEMRRRTALLWSSLAAAFLAAVVVAAAAGRLPWEVPLLYLVLSVVAIAVYAWDKSAARVGAWRTQEGTLHLLALLGGWPGALIAQQLLRHKSRKASFRGVFWATVVANCAALSWAFTPSGARLLGELLAVVYG